MPDLRSSASSRRSNGEPKKNYGSVGRKQNDNMSNHSSVQGLFPQSSHYQHPTGQVVPPVPSLPEYSQQKQSRSYYKSPSDHHGSYIPPGTSFDDSSSSQFSTSGLEQQQQHYHHSLAAPATSVLRQPKGPDAHFDFARPSPSSARREEAYEIGQVESQTGAALEF
jgi:hypothetical protein